jgi:hypothetical protein
MRYAVQSKVTLIRGRSQFTLSPTSHAQGKNRKHIAVTRAPSEPSLRIYGLALYVNMANSQGTQAHDPQMLDDRAGTAGIMPAVSVALNCRNCLDMMTGKPRR